MERSIRQLSQARNAGEEEENCAAETHWSTPQKGSWKGMALRRKNSNTLCECQERGSFAPATKRGGQASGALMMLRPLFFPRAHALG
jgi:hypothetical protein